MNNFEDKTENMLNKLKLREIGVEEKDHLWHRIMTEKAKVRTHEGSLLIFNFNYKQMTIIAGLILALVLGTGGVVAASNDARPGDALFGVDLAVEKMQLKLADENEKSELRLKFAAERLKETKEVAENNKEKNEDSDSDSVKSEAKLKSKQNADLNTAIGDIEVFIDEELDEENDAELRAALEDIIVILEADDNVEIKRAGNKIKIESDTESSGEIKLEIKDTPGNDDNEGEGDGVRIKLDGNLDIGDD